MKILNLLCMFYITSIFGQTVVSKHRNNSLYFGIENDVSISIPDVPSNLLFLSSNNAIIKKFGDFNYKITPLKNVRSQMEINVFSIKGKNTLSQESQIYEIIEIPISDTYVAETEKSMDKVTQIHENLFKSSPTLFFKMPDDFIYSDKIKTNVESFSLMYKSENETKEANIIGNKIPSETLKELLNLPNQTEIVIFNIIVLNGNVKK